MKKSTIFLAFLLFVGFQASAQMQIKGTVTGAEDGLTIPGVSVVVKGNPSIGITTDIDGNYTLTVPSVAEALVFSFIGMKTQEVVIGGRSVIDVAMQLDVLGLEEVIVLGYSSKGKNQITGSSVQIAGDVLDKTPTVSIEQSLKGRIAGVNISASEGTPGASQSIRIRGAGSITSNNEPLYVIDGVPIISGDFSDMDDESNTTFNLMSAFNSSDIETITVLKDASATSAYGARGSNGVIVITTKSGKKGETKFNLSTSYGFQNNAVKGRQALSGEQSFELYNEGIYNSWGVDYDFTREEAWDKAKEWEMYYYNHYQKWIDAGRPNTSWEEAFGNKNAQVTRVNFSATGGNEGSSFYASVGYNKTEGTVVGSDFERISGDFKYDKTLFESNRALFSNVKFSTIATASNSKQNGILEQSAYYSSPHAAKYFLSNIFSPYNEDGTVNITMPASNRNYLYLKDNDITSNDMNRIMTNSSISIDIYKGLTFKTRYSLDYTVIDKVDFANRNYGDAKSSGGNNYEEITQNTNTVWQNSLNYKFDINSSHHFDLMLLSEYQKNINEVLWGYGETFAGNGLTYLDNAAANKDAGSSLYDWVNVSYLGMANYNYEGKYVIDITYRREGSSKFAEENRFGNFYAIGAAWNMKQEDFMSNLTYISNLRLRGSYGTSGNAGIDANSYQALLGFDARYNNTGSPYPSQLGNSNLTWEKNKNYDVGFEFGLFDNRLSGSFAYFNKETFDLLLEVPISSTSGFNIYQENVGSMINKGIEIELNGDIIRTKDFKVNLGVNFGTVDNEVTKLAVDPNGEYLNIQTYAKKVEVGTPVYSWFLKKWAGVDVANGEALWFINGVDGETTTDYYAAQKAYQGANALPTYNGGANLNVDYKGIYLNVDVTFAGGNKILETWAEYYNNSGNYSVASYQGTTLLMDRWQNPGDITDVPKRVSDDWDTYDAEPSTRWLYDGDYIRLSGLTLGYNLPKSICNKIGLEGINIYGRATNYLTWVKDKGLEFDPETRATGYTTLTTPPVKSIIFGLNLNF